MSSNSNTQFNIINMIFNNLYWIVPLILLYIWYVQIVGKRNKVLESLSGIDVQLNKRFDLIPNVIKSVVKYMEHEKHLLNELTELRTKGSKDYNKSNPDEVKEHLNSNNLLKNKLSELMINVENYPDLKADQTIINAQLTLNEIEEQISAARRFYNSSVTRLNDSIQIFPGNILAKLVGIQPMPYFQSDEKTKENIDINNFFK